MVDGVRASLLQVLAPTRCAFCERPGAIVCAGCRRSLPWHGPACRACAMPLAPAAGMVCRECLIEAPAQDRTWAALRYAAPASQQILDLKFHGRLAPAHVLGHLMAQELARRAAPLPELLIPVPLHPSRLRRRGYNQALEIARVIARQLGVTVAPDAARRVRATREQTRLAATERRRNLLGAFAVNPAVRGRRIALLDDVITTGATVAELARTARASGAAVIEVWAAARAS